MGRRRASAEIAAAVELMPSRIIIGGRQIGTGKYGGEPKCLCGEIVEILGRCAKCHDALRRRRLGLAPNDDAEKKRLAGYLEKHQARMGRCAECGAHTDEDHDQRCAYADV